MEYTELLERQIIGRLKVDNPWWTEGVTSEYYRQMSPRLYLNIFYPLVQDTITRRATILMGRVFKIGFKNLRIFCQWFQAF